MKFEIGDKVKLIYSNEIGFIEAEINKEMFQVNVNGVSFPVFNDQIEHPYLDNFLKNSSSSKIEKIALEDIPKEKKTSFSLKEPFGVGLNVLPIFKTNETEDEVEILKLSLFNNTEQDFNFTYAFQKDAQVEITFKSELLQNSIFYLQDIDFEVLNDKPFFEFEFSLKQPDKKKVPYYFYELKLKPKQIFSNIQKVRSGEIASFNLLFFEEYPSYKKTENILTTNFYPKEKNKNLLKPKPKELFHHVIDLHIENIDASAKGLNNSEIITIQLAAFEKFLDTAFQHYEKYLIVIHGIGEGSLRNSIHQLLKQYSQVKTFVNQYHPLYGFGATEIYLE